MTANLVSTYGRQMRSEIVVHFLGHFVTVPDGIGRHDSEGVSDGNGNIR